MRVALIGYGGVARAFVDLLAARRHQFPFRIAGAHTRRATAYSEALRFESPAPSVEAFLDRTQPEVLVELSSLNPHTGEPAISHIRAAFARGIHVVTANKGPIAHAWPALRDEAAARGLQFRFESTVVDGTPVFNLVRNCLPGVKIEGFSGALNSTSKVILAALAEGLSLDEGIARAQALGIAEADPSYDIDGWDSAVKAAALANVLMDAAVTPADVEREGIRHLSPATVRDALATGHIWVLTSRAETLASGRVRLRVRPERLPVSDPLATVQGTSNLLLLHTDLMGTVGTVSIEPGVAQTAYGILSDLVDITRNL